MARLNVTQPDGGTAVFNTVTDDFVEFNVDPGPFAEYLSWNEAVRYAFGSSMQISHGLRTAIRLGLTSEQEIEHATHDQR